MTDVKVEFFEPPAVPGFGAAGGFSLRLLDKTNTTDYQRLGEVNDGFMAALSKRKELKGLFTFYSSDYPQYELVINNDVAMQKGVSIGKALDNLNIHHRQHLRARASFCTANSTRSTSRPRRSSGGTPKTWATCSSRTTTGKWSRTPRSCGSRSSKA